MDDWEARQYYQAIYELLQRLGATWILEHLDDCIRQGKQVYKTVSATPEADESTGVWPSGTEKRKTKIRFSASEEYSSEERLQLLLDAIATGTLDTGTIANECFRLTPFHEFRLLSEDTIPRQREIKEGVLVLPLTLAEELLQQTNELRKRISNPHGPHKPK